MIIKRDRFLLLLVLLLSGSVFAGAHTSSPAGGYGSDAMHGGMGMMPRMAEKLELSEAQKQDMAALVEMYRPRFKEIAARGKADREALLAMAPDDPAYASATAKVSNEAGLAAAEVVTLMSELQGNVYALLTAEQQAKYLELRQTQREKMDERRQQHKDCMSKEGATRADCMHKGKGRHKGHHKEHHEGHGNGHHKNCDDKECPLHEPSAEGDQS